MAKRRLARTDKRPARAGKRRRDRPRHGGVAGVGAASGSAVAPQGARRGPAQSEGYPEIRVCVGTLEVVDGRYCVVPDDRRRFPAAYVSRKDLGGARPGHKVIARMLLGDGEASRARKCDGEASRARRSERTSRAPAESWDARAVITRVLGFADDPGVDVMSAILARGFSTEFPKPALDEAEALPPGISQRAAISLLVRRHVAHARRDMRGLRVFTIDGDDARDLDDAVSIERLGCAAIGAPASGAVGRRLDHGAMASVTGGVSGTALSGASGFEPLPYALTPQPRAVDAAFRLGVHIADVSHYVRPGSALDREARARGTSVYLVDRVLPMLPERLSNGLCSLNPGQDRLAVSVFMDISRDGRVISFDAFESIIRSSARVTYAQADEAIARAMHKGVEDCGATEDAPCRGLRESAVGVDGETGIAGGVTGGVTGGIAGGVAGEPPDGLPPEIAGDILAMDELARALRKKRIAAGAVDFAIDEQRVTVDGLGNPVAVTAARQTQANRLIEEFMVACNETVAGWLSRVRAPIPYRTHDKPDPERLEAFRAFAKGVGMDIGLRKAADASRKLISAAISASRGTVLERVVAMSLLRAMARAAYTQENVGHYGLASPTYCHFTAPIRRYPDIAVHRALKATIASLGAAAPKPTPQRSDALRKLCAQCSERERAAAETERAVRDMKAAEYMSRHVSEVFEGVVTGVAPRSVFVCLDNLVEGRMPLSGMPDDYYEYDAEKQRLVGQSTGASVKAGDVVAVRLVRVDPAARQVYFEQA